MIFKTRSKRTAVRLPEGVAGQTRNRNNLMNIPEAIPEEKYFINEQPDSSQGIPQTEMSEELFERIPTSSGRLSSEG